MKKTLKQLLALSAMMLLGTGLANAVDYGIYVGDTKITSSNASDVLRDGHFSYDASTKTLTMSNARLDSDGTLGTGIRNDEVDGLVLNIVGYNKITSRNTSIYTSKSLEFTGTGTLYCTSTNSYGLGLSGDNITCTISADVRFYANRNGVYDYKKTATLYLKGNYVSLYLAPSNGNSAIYGLGNLMLGSEISFQNPPNAYFSKTLHSITTDGTSNYKDAVTIAANHLYVGEEKVYVTETKDVFGDGQFKYDATTKTLTVRNAKLTNSDGTLGNGISNRGIQGLTIKIEGDNTFKTRNPSISSNCSFDITGTGTLTGSCGQSNAIHLWGDGMTCTVNGPTIDLSSQGSGLYDYYHTATLRVKGSTTNLTLNPSGLGHKTIDGLGNLSLGSGIHILEPQGGYFSSELKSITTNGTKAYTKKVVIGHAEEYGIVIGGVMVTELNAADVLDNGQFSYDPGSKTLTVTNANLTEVGISNRRVDGLNVKLVGDSKISTTDQSPFDSGLSFSFTGTGSLTCTSTEFYALTLWGSSIMCTVDGPTLNFISKSKNALLDYYHSSTLNVMRGTNSTTCITLQSGSGYETIKDLGWLFLDSKVTITAPQGGYYSSSLKSITTDGATAYEGTIVIRANYGIRIGETLVNPSNCEDLFGNGQFSYDPGSKTLTLNNASLTNDNGNGIEAREVDGLRLTIRLVGDNVINSKKEAIYSALDLLTITGDGTLTATSTNYAALGLLGNCTIDGPQIDLTGSFGCVRDYHSNATLTVKGSNTRLTLKKSGGPDWCTTIYGLKDLKLQDNVMILEPTGGYFSSELKSITTDGTNAYNDTIVIGKPKEYGLFIGETKVTDLNAADVLNDGEFSYDPKTKTLTVRNATLDNSGSMGNCIANREITGLIINLEGDNFFNARNAAISSARSLTITGTGSLTGISTDAHAIYLSGDNITCTIDGPSLEMMGNIYGLRCYGGNNTLVVEGDNTVVSLLSASYNETISNLGSLRLGDNLGITNPKDGYFSETLKSVTADGIGAYRGRVIISYKAKSDVNGDGVTDVADIANIIDIMAADDSHSGKGDVNGDGVTDVADIAAVIDIMAEGERK